MADLRLLPAKIMSTRISHALLKLTPVKKALMNDMLRSRFLNLMKKGVLKQGRGWIAEL